MTIRTLDNIGHPRFASLVSGWGEEGNPFADSATCNNGGGYYQPRGGALWSVPGIGDVLVEYEDTSCGDFGSRWDAQITICATGRTWSMQVDQLRSSNEQEGLAQWRDAASHGVYRALRGISGLWLVRSTRMVVGTAAYRMRPACMQDAVGV